MKATKTFFYAPFALACSALFLFSSCDKDDGYSVNGNGNGNSQPDTVRCIPGGTSVVDVTNPTTGAIWMDRNLGASHQASFNTDSLAYGDLYQWGRFPDGHQCRDSDTTSIRSSTDIPGHGNFILIDISDYEIPKDWRIPQNNSLWQGVNGANNPCPSGYRLPTENELENELQSWSSRDDLGAFDSPLKLPLAGRRMASSGSFGSVGSSGNYWSSTVEGPRVSYLYFFHSTAFNRISDNRVHARSVRCIKD